jgi:hypothetical protein
MEIVDELIVDGDDMRSMYDLWEDSDEYVRLDVATQTDPAQTAAVEVAVQAIEEAKSIGTQQEIQQCDRMVQTEAGTKEVKVTIYKNEKKMAVMETQTEDEEKLSDVFDQSLTQMTIFYKLAQKIEENMRWPGARNESFNLGTWGSPFEGYRLGAYEQELGRSVNLEKHEDVDRDVNQWVTILGKIGSKWRGEGFLTWMELETEGKKKLIFAQVTRFEYRLDDTFKARWGNLTQDRFMSLIMGDRIFGQDQKAYTRMDRAGKRQSTMRDRW